MIYVIAFSKLCVREMGWCLCCIYVSGFLGDGFSWCRRLKPAVSLMVDDLELGSRQFTVETQST